VKATISTRNALAIVLSAIVLTAVVTYVFAASSTIPFTISGGNYPGAPSYTIWREGSNYFAKNASGVIEFSGTNASQVINNALSNGGRIFCKAGTYIIDSTLLIGDDTWLIGEGIDKTIFYLADNANCRIVNNTDQTNGNTNIHIEGITFNLNGQGQTASNEFYFYKVGNSSLRNIKIQNGYRFALYWGSGVANLTDAENSLNRYNIIEGCVFDTSLDDDLAIFGSFIDSVITNNFFFNADNYGLSTRYMKRTVIDSNIFKGNKHGIGLESVANIVISNNEVYLSDSSGIFIIDVNSVANYNITITGNIVYNNGLNTAVDGEGIRIRNAYGVTITGNIISGNGLDGIRLEGINKAVISNNIIESNNQREISNHGGIHIKNATTGLALDSAYIIISNNQIHGSPQKWGIYESNGVFNLTITNVMCIDNDVGGIHVLNSTATPYGPTYVFHSWNGTSWIP